MSFLHECHSAPVSLVRTKSEWPQRYLLVLFLKCAKELWRRSSRQTRICHRKNQSDIGFSFGVIGFFSDWFSRWRMCANTGNKLREYLRWRRNRLVPAVITFSQVVFTQWICSLRSFVQPTNCDKFTYCSCVVPPRVITTSADSPFRRSCIRRRQAHR